MSESPSHSRIGCAAFDGLRKQFEHHSLRFNNFSHHYAEYQLDQRHLVSNAVETGKYPKSIASHHLWDGSHRIFRDGHWKRHHFLDFTPEIMWSGLYSGDGLLEFVRLADTAEELLQTYRVGIPVPRELSERFKAGGWPEIPLVLPDEHHCWPRVLHWLSWAGEVMPARRTAKLSRGDSRRDELDQWLAEVPPVDVPLDRWHLFSSDPAPRTFSSCLDNLYLRSVVALEWIIARLESAPPAHEEKGATLEPSSKVGDQGQEAHQSAPGKRWYTVTEAANAANTDRGTISRAVDDDRLKSNGKSGRDRRIDAIDLTRWILERSKRSEPVESNEHVEKLMRRAAKK